MKKLFLILIVTLFSCNNVKKNSSQLHDDETLKKVFTSAEIANLQKVLDYFDNHVFPNTIDYNLDYYNYFDHLSEVESYDDLLNKLDLKSSEFNTLLDGLIKNGFFSGIWVEETNVLNGKKSLTINFNGKFLKFLKLMGDDYSFLKSYSENIEIMGGIGVSAMGGFLKEYYKQVDFSNPSFRLIWAVHYISVISDVNAMER